ncbi:cell division protein SepF [Corynebacterium ulceribovis]|uniref:cell division protein SepF n=1 Tax=Corynebacterium ulceribovis TaxID=487732 RepID=UPI000363F7E7|nr:cell division protein SepF [Corynebacterium ulceribovis]
MAGFLERTKDFFGLTPIDDFEDEYFDGYDREYDRGGRDHDVRDARDMHDAYETQHAPRRYARPAVDEHDDYYERRDERRAPRLVEPAAPSVPAVAEPLYIPEEITLVATEYGDAVQIGDAVKRGDVVLFDVSNMSTAEAKRIIDFAAGLAYAFDGHFKRRSGRVFEIAKMESFKTYTAGQRQSV